MTDISAGGTTKTSESLDDITAQRRQATIQNMLAMYAGFSLFVFAGLVAVGTYSYVSHRNPENLAPFEYALIAGAIFIALSSLFFGTRVILSGLSLANVVLPPQDRKLLEDLIRDGNEKGIDQYVRLSSLSGTTGAATKLGLTGLPLATASLTIFFSALAVLGINGFLDLYNKTDARRIHRLVCAEKPIGRKAGFWRGPSYAPMKTTILLDGIRPPRQSVEADPVLVRSRDTKSAIAKQCNGST